jgi:DhnA family fructose-bisphosphate aldolase class Ia
VSGVEIRLGQLFDRRSGRAFIAAIDHGVTTGVPVGAERAIETIGRVVGCEPDGVLIGPGMLAKAGHLFAFRGAPAALLRTDWIINDPRLEKLEQGEGYRVLCSPQRAAELGADAIVQFLVHGVREGSMYADNVRAVSQAAEAAARVGLPLIVEVTLWGSRIQDRKEPDLLAFGCRMAAELGADAIKTEWTGDRATMADVINGCPVPVLVLGGAKSPTPEPLLEATREAMAAGARGVIYGRNVWQAADPLMISRQLREIIHSA